MMTNEEAIELLKKEFSECRDTISVYAEKRKKAFDMAIKALEQQLVLDNIRAEIEQVADDEEVHDEKWALGLRYAVNIIDKYRESEELYYD